MHKTTIVLFNGIATSVPAIETNENDIIKLIPLIPSDWANVTTLGNPYQSFVGTTRHEQLKLNPQSSNDSLIEQLKALTAALTAQTTAISQLVNSNLEIVDQMMAAEPEEGNLSGYLDGSDEL
ncbi:hypothetical protein G3495_11010 [Shewanella baltica]|uniref:hypothetical protein n=1 Tax=Shewanella baltica TaxID=62322 RepID=UPI00217DA2B3|nr:hypothetical protein [Shewanella baltica]MCS6235650.1 hypothetical protein [Shewanella baltica]MCS6270187.1 hypothetical protein [Shewanella baltica]